MTEYEDFERNFMTRFAFKESLDRGGTIEIPLKHERLAMILVKEYIARLTSDGRNFYKANFELKFN